MNLVKGKALIISISAALSLAAGPAPYRKLIAESRQALVVTTEGWNSVNGTLHYFEKNAGGWRQIGENVRVVVGKNGLAWDAAPPAHDIAGELVKREGDGRSPAGVFRLNPQFGFDSSAPGKRMKYFPLTGESECVDDVNSKFYNQVVTRNHVAHPDWNSSEKMREIGQYKFGIIVRYNPRKAKNLGSCIFLHVWQGPDRGTAGCTAMDETALQQIMRTLDEKKKPILIELPAPAYETLRGPWHLP